MGQDSARVLAGTKAPLRSLTDGMDALAGQRSVLHMRLWFLVIWAGSFWSSVLWAASELGPGRSETAGFALQVSFSDEEPDFVPPPPRDEDVEIQASDDGVAPEPTPLEVDVPPPSRLPAPRPQEPLIPVPPAEPQPIAEDLLPPDRSHYDPSWNTANYTPNTLQVLPSGLLYRSYLAGEKESRIGASWLKDRNGKLNWETTLGGRVGLLRYGTTGAVQPRGWQLDIEGAALPMIYPGDPSSPLQATDYRFGILSTWAFDDWHVKAGYYHLSSHVGDELLIANPAFQRLNYVRDSSILGVVYDLTPEWQTYGEIGYAFNAEDGAEPLELQYGLQYSPMDSSLRGAPFAAINGHTRQDFDYITSVNVMAGWQWRGAESQHLWRMGFQYYKGPSLQYEFAGRNDRLIGGGVWFDF